MPAEPSAKGSRRSLRIGPYSVEASVALGSLGSAYRAKDLESGRTVALKVLSAELTDNSAARDRFQHEAERAKKVRSPNVVNVLDFGDANGTWYLAMELADGPTLSEHVQRHGPLDATAAQYALVQASRALAALHREGLVPRDLSADNFRVSGGADGKGDLTLKLLDIGLLRPATEESLGDIRTALGALGSLGCFLLTGRSGKADLGSLADKVSDDFRTVLRRLIGQRGEERITTPDALLAALGAEEPESHAAADDSPIADFDALAALAELVEEDAQPRKGSAAKKAARPREEDEEAVTEETPPAHSRRDTTDLEDEEDEPVGKPRSKRKPAGIPKGLIWGGAAFAGAVIVGLIVWAALRSDDPAKSTGQQAQATKPDGTNPPPENPNKDKPADPKKEPDKPKDDQQAATVPWLYEFKQAPDWAAIEKEYQGPWTTPAPAPPADTPVFTVARVPQPGAKPGTAFDSIAAACAAIPEGKWGIINIQDNGPFIESPIRVSGRNVYLRGAKKFAPLIVWDPSQTRVELKPGKPADAEPKSDVPTFLTVDKGTLLLDNVHIAVDWPEKIAGTGCLVRVSGGELRVAESTLSVAGKPHSPVTAVRFEGGAGQRCGLIKCFVRGARMTALDLPTAGADVMIGLSLLVTTEAPLLSVAGGKGADAASTLRVIRSTLVARDSVLQVGAAPEAPAEPSLRWMGWDALLLRAAQDSGGTMVDLPKDASAKGMSWRAINSLYAGWDNLLSGRDPVDGANEDAWHNAWNLPEGDRSLPHLWVKTLPADPAEVLPSAYQTFGTPLAFQTRYLPPGLLGCELFQLPWTRGRWVDITTQRARPMDADVQADAAPPLPQAADLLYHGERLDLDKIPDLGTYLSDVQKKQKLAPIVVLQVHGKGKHKTRPVRVEGSHLFIYVEPAAKDAEPLVLEPDVSVVPNANALFEVTRGNLWLVGVDVRCPDFKTALLPSYLVMVRDGHLLMTASRLQGPLNQPPPNYWGLIRMEGTGSGIRGSTFTISINQCVLLSSKFGVHLACAGLRVDFRDSLIVSTDRAVAIQTAMPPQKSVPGYPTPAGSPSALHGLFGEAILNMEITADHCTFAGKDATFYLEDVPVEERAEPYLWPVIDDPILVQTRNCAFLNPFVDKDSTAAAALLAYGGSAVQRGLLCWQAEGNVYDKRFHAYLTTMGAAAKPVRLEKPQTFATWERLWGQSESKPHLDVVLKNTLDLEKLALDQLALPAQPVLKDKPGADLKKLLEPRKAK